MKVIAGGMAEYTNSDSGSVNIIGLRQSQSLDSVPERIDVSFFLVVVPSEEEYGKKTVVGLEMFAPDGAPVVQAAEINVELAAPDVQDAISTTHLHLRAAGLRLPVFGRYKYRFYTGQEKATIFEAEFGVFSSKPESKRR